MKKLQVLVATMGQRDFSLIEKMNLCCDAIIANQADREEIVTQNNVKMITTATRGVGLNRNIALLAADSEIVLFADDDMTYYDGMPQAVVQAFRENPKADVMVFGIDITKGGVITEKRHLKKKRLHVWNSMRYGTVRVAVRREAILWGNIMFNQCFGGGCMYSAGEDSLFLKACFDKKLRVYAHDYVLGTCCKDESSWFVGYNDKYFYDKGALMRFLFPTMPHLSALYFAIRFKRQTELSVPKRIRLMMKGVKGAKTMEPYRDGL
jgi:glycosyltransferase involved in cell wall biosynthesis